MLFSFRSKVGFAVSVGGRNVHHWICLSPVAVARWNYDLVLFLVPNKRYGVWNPVRSAVNMTFAVFVGELKYLAQL